jgi:hypothetical protein
MVERFVGAADEQRDKLGPLHPLVQLGGLEEVAANRRVSTQYLGKAQGTRKA